MVWKTFLLRLIPQLLNRFDDCFLVRFCGIKFNPCFFLVIVGRGSCHAVNLRHNHLNPNRARTAMHAYNVEFNFFHNFVLNNKDKIKTKLFYCVISNYALLLVVIPAKAGIQEYYSYTKFYFFYL